VIISTWFHEHAEEGFISREAFLNLLMKFNIENPAIHDYVYRYYDKDHNGKLDFFEFVYAFLI
jgi:hypothetical protein